MKAMHIMKKNILSIDPSETLRDALDLMDDFGLDELPVVDEGNFIGVITSGSIHQASRLLGPFEDIPDRPVADLMGYGTTCNPKDEGFRVLDHMEQDDAHHSYVVSDDGKLLGEIDVEELVETLPSEVNASARPPKGWGRKFPQAST